MSVDSIAAIATIVAALIAALFSIVSLTVSKEMKTSEFRQAWIDGLQEDPASWLASARAFSRFTDAKRRLGDDYQKNVSFPISDEKVGDLRFVAAHSTYKIKLRLNPKEGNHQELIRLLDKAIQLQNEFMQNGVDHGILDAVDRVAVHSQEVLKFEWERVKEGEKAFKTVRNRLAPGIAIFALILIALIVVTQRSNKVVKTTPASASASHD